MEDLLLPDLCKICNAKLTGHSQAVSHYSSERHRTRMEAYHQSYKISISTECYCYVCCTNFTEKNAKYAHINTFPHKQLSILKSELIKSGIKDTFWIVGHLAKNPKVATITCTICKVTSACKINFMQHINGYSHTETFESWKMSDKRKLMEPLEYNNNNFYCITCNKPLNGTSDCQRHYTTVSHLNLEDKKTNSTRPLCNSTTLIQNQTIAKPPSHSTSFVPPAANFSHYKDIEALLLPNDRGTVINLDQPKVDSRHVPEQHREYQATFPITNYKPGSEASYYCYVCCTNLKDIESKRTHIASFPHKELSAIKSELFKMGIKKQFWKVEQFPTASQPAIITCIICNVTSPCEKNFLEHINGSRHNNVCESWKGPLLRQQVNALECENNYFYCQTCQKALNGTNDAAKHYTGKAHLDKLQQKKSRSYFDFDGFPPLTSSQSVNSNENRTTPASAPCTGISMKTPGNEVPKDTPLELQVDHINKTTNSQNMKQQVFSELENLVQKLYFSQTVPYDKALEFLKKVNKDIDALAKEYKKPEKGSEATNGKIFHESTAPDIRTTKREATLKDTLSTVSVNHFSDETPFNGKLNNLSTDIKVIVGNKAVTLEIPSSAVTPAQVPFNVEITHSTEAAVEATNGQKCDISNAKDITELLQQVVQRKEKVEANSNGKVSLEMELLQEIEILINQIDTADIPLDLLLQYLEDSNKRLEFISDTPVDSHNVKDVGKQTETKNSSPLLDINAKNASAIDEGEILQTEKQLEAAQISSSLTETNIVPASAVLEREAKEVKPMYSKEELLDCRTIETFWTVPRELKNTDKIYVQDVKYHSLCNGYFDDRFLNLSDVSLRGSIRKTNADNASAARQKLEREGALDETVKLVHSNEEPLDLIVVEATIPSELQNVYKTYIQKFNYPSVYNYYLHDNFREIRNFLEAHLKSSTNDYYTRLGQLKKVYYTEEGLLSFGTVKPFCPIPKDCYKIYLKDPSFYNYYLKENLGRFMNYLDVYLGNFPTGYRLQQLDDDSVISAHGETKRKSFNNTILTYFGPQNETSPALSAPGSSQNMVREVQRDEMSLMSVNRKFIKFMDFLNLYLQGPAVNLATPPGSQMQDNDESLPSDDMLNCNKS